MALIILTAEQRRVCLLLQFYKTRSRLLLDLLHDTETDLPDVITDVILTTIIIWVSLSSLSHSL